MGVLLYAANENHLNDVEVAKVGGFETALLAYMQAEHGDLMAEIVADGNWNDDREAVFKTAIETFKSTQAW